MKRNDLLRDQWGSLGVAFTFSEKNECDPETALVGFVTSSEFPEDKKMVSIVLVWLKEYSTFVHIEKLKSSLQNLGKDELLILGALASKCIRFGDYRWRTIEKLVLQKTKGYKSTLSDSEVLLKRQGCDEDFLRFGIRVVPVFPEDPKKLLVRSRIFKMNSWLRHRLLFGTNLRADIATTKFLKLTDTAYGAAKLLGCSINAAYRNWNDLTEAGWAG